MKNKRNDKHHVNGRLHKKKALVAAYGPDVESYLQYRSRKDGYDALNRIINQACVPLEKEEVESEPPASREIRAKLLGVFNHFMIYLITHNYFRCIVEPKISCVTDIITIFYSCSTLLCMYVLTLNNPSSTAIYRVD